MLTRIGGGTAFLVILFVQFVFILFRAQKSLFVLYLLKLCRGACVVRRRCGGISELGAAAEHLRRERRAAESRGHDQLLAKSDNFISACYYVGGGQGAIPVSQQERQDVGRAAPRHARRADGVLGARHVARRQRALRAAAAAGGAPARGLGAALVHGARHSARQRRHPGVRVPEANAAAGRRRALHLRPARHRHVGARTERLSVRAHRACPGRRALARLPGAHVLRRARRLHQLRALLPVPAALPRPLPRHLPGGRGAQRLRAESAGARAGRRRRARVPALRRQLHAGAALCAAAVRARRLPADARLPVRPEPHQLRADQLAAGLPGGARGAVRHRQARGGARAPRGAAVGALGGGADADAGAERAHERRAAVRAVVLVHAVRRAHLPPGGDAGRDGQPGRVPVRRVAGAAERARPGRAAGGGVRAARLHPGDGAAEPGAAAAGRGGRRGAGGVLVGGGDGRGVVRAHVGVRVGAGRRRARHARHGRRHAAGLDAGLGAALLPGEPRAAVHAGAGLPAALRVIAHLRTDLASAPPFQIPLVIQVTVTQ